MKKKFLRILKKKGKKPLVCLTAYSKPISKIIDKYCDIVLVGDSVGTALYGLKDTHEVKLDTMIMHAKSVSSNLNNALCVVDLPFNTYRNVNEAKRNSKLIIKETNCDAVKVECNGKNFNIIDGLVKARIPVMGHIGFTPQFYKKFKVQGKKKREHNKLIEQAKKIEKAGAFSIVLECINSSLAKEITGILKIPTIGIGASVYCDGQILVTDDMIGLSGFYPKFVKKFVKIDKIIEKGVQKYKSDVLNKKFPNKKNKF